MRFVVFGWAILVILAMVGWVMNVISLVKVGGFQGNELEIVIRVVGIFAAPVGGVIGWIY